MTTPIAPIAAIGGFGGPAAAGTAASAASGLGGIAGVPGALASAASAPNPTSGVDFAQALSDGLDAVAASQSRADHLAIQAATGNLVDPAQYTIAATQAQLMTQLATTIQSKAVAAFNTIMGMQA